VDHQVVGLGADVWPPGDEEASAAARLLLEDREDSAVQVELDEFAIRHGLERDVHRSGSAVGRDDDLGVDGIGECAFTESRELGGSGRDLIDEISDFDPVLLCQVAERGNLDQALGSADIRKASDAVRDPTQRREILVGEDVITLHHDDVDVVGSEVEHGLPVHFLPRVPAREEWLGRGIELNAQPRRVDAELNAQPRRIDAEERCRSSERYGREDRERRARVGHDQ
jgi:hypothetical protein